MQALQFIVEALLTLVVIAFLLRVLLPLVRADLRNPFSAAILRVTNPVVLPLRRVLPAAGRIDTASVVALLAVQIVATAILFLLSGVAWPNLLVLITTALRMLAQTLVQFYFFAILLYALLSWIAPGTYSPIASVLTSLSEPLLAPVRRVVPPIGGLDLSALFVLIGLQAVLILLR
ncbi:MAG TPA: YggT family protein [Steroidobacteraceae bacterium]|nr:YggT family protein [Steroidobacteraceae bacterium]